MVQAGPRDRRAPLGNAERAGLVERSHFPLRHMEACCVIPTKVGTHEHERSEFSNSAFMGPGSSPGCSKNTARRALHQRRPVGRAAPVVAGAAAALRPRREMVWSA